jgi:hypothetical protein
MMRILISEHQYKSLIDESKNLQEVLADDIPDYMKDIIQKRYKGDYLNREVPKHTDKIPNVNMEIKNDEVVDFASNLLIRSVTDKLVEQLRKSEIWKEYNNNPTGYSFVDGPLKVIMRASIPSLEKRLPYMSEDTSSVGTLVKYTWFYSKAFRLPDSRLNNDSTLQGNPEDGKGWDYSINADKIKWSNNTTGLPGFIAAIKKVFPKTFGYLDVDKITRDKHYVGLREPIINYQQNINKIGQYPLYLYITDKPDDKLRMSVSQFYDSCQNIYTGGEPGTQWNKKLLSNVFDKNSKVAYLIYNKPYKDTKGNEHPYTSIARCILRVNKDGGVMFDKVYPTNLQNVFYNIITESTGIENVGKDDDTYDYENVDGLPTPYMDKYKLKSTGINNEGKINALMAALNVDRNNIDVIDDERINVRNRRFDNSRYIVEDYVVITFDEAVERSSDIMRDDFIEIYGGHEVIEVLSGIVDGWDFLQVLDIEEEYYDYVNKKHEEEDESNIPDFLSEVYGVDTVYDMEDILKKNKVNAQQWFSGNIEMDEIVERHGGEEEFLTRVLEWSHEEVGFTSQNTYVYYRTDHTIDRDYVPQ